MQPFQYNLRCSSAKNNNFMHAATSLRHLDAANAFCNITSQTRISLRTWKHNVATFIQPFHCDLRLKDSTFAKNCARTMHQSFHNTEEPKDVKTIVPLTAAHTSYHATFMQPFHCDLQPVRSSHTPPFIAVYCYVM